MPTAKILPSNKSSRRRLNTGSALIVDRRQLLHLLRWAPQLPALPQLAFVATLNSAEVSSSLSGQPIMDRHGSVVPSQSSLVEPRINKRRERSRSETKDGPADTSRGVIER